MSRIGLFGGTFNPIHNGHINSLKTVIKEIELDQVKVILASQSPNRRISRGASLEQRLNMLELCFNESSEKIVIDDCELIRGGISYTVDTISHLKSNNNDDEFFLIIGQDQFDNFTSWKDFEQILKDVHLIVTSRPGRSLPKNFSDMPEEIVDLCKDFNNSKITLNSGKEIFFVQLEDIDVSSSEIRKRVRIGEPIMDMVSKSVEEYITAEDLYQVKAEEGVDYKELTRFCGDVLFLKKGIEVSGRDLSQLNSLCEFTLIASGTSRKHTQSLAESLVESVRKTFNIKPVNIEGSGEGEWVLVDYGSLIVHVFYDYKRQEYKLEELWSEGVNLNLKDPTL